MVLRERWWRFGVSCDVIWSSWYEEYVVQWNDEVRLRLCWKGQGVGLVQRGSPDARDRHPFPHFAEADHRLSLAEAHNFRAGLASHSRASHTQSDSCGFERRLRGGDPVQAPLDKQLLHRGTSLE